MSDSTKVILPNPKIIEDTLSAEWKLAPAFISRYLSDYYLLHWNRSYLVAQLSRTGTITRCGIEYKAVLENPEAANFSKLRMSFRATTSPRLPNIVLIQGLWDNERNRPHIIRG